MLRAVLAVALAAALLGVATPVVEDARADRTGHAAAGALDRVAERALGLAAAGEVGPDAAPRRVVELSLPAPGLAAAPVEYVAVGGVPGCGTARDTATGDVLAYRVAGRAPRVRSVPVDLRAVEGGRVRGDEDPLVLRGSASLTLSLVRRAGGRTVLVRRTGTPRPGVGGRATADRSPDGGLRSRGPSNGRHAAADAEPGRGDAGA